MSSTTLGRRESRKQDRRQAIVEAARAAFFAEGYTGMSMSGLLKVIGGSKATLWSYFRSKEELFAAVLEDVIAVYRSQMEEMVAARGPLHETLRAFCSGMLRKLVAPDPLATWRLVVAESGRNPEIGRIFYQRAVHSTERALAQYFSEQIAIGQLREASPLLMVEMLTSLCAGQQARLLWGLASADEVAIEQKASEFTEVFLKSFGVTPVSCGDTSARPA
jgi:TetR/AcrR family transcriptional repressor of mexJK operon